MTNTKNESFPDLNNITPANRIFLKEHFGSYTPENQPTFSDIPFEEGALGYWCEQVKVYYDIETGELDIELVLE